MIYKFCEQLRNTSESYTILLKYCDKDTDNKVFGISNWNTTDDNYTSRYYYVENGKLLFTNSSLMGKYYNHSQYKQYEIILID